ncbi:DUF6152 family protein [Sphingomonas sp. M1-B02]|uniref:DUF6152 family protein n=1 Tax=Sphingomonas sp. M1-B02 TaxID=3114300 RepID=UPI0022403A80|nr:DUF6152 family protein [Sphingomonas sp. S6-11]UZK66079.1 DUF6152 family protein [Sphingomonas sp. S6-11]
MARITTFAAAAIALTVPVAALAHHGWSAYDESKPITVTGSLTSVSWGNPHGSAKMRWQGKEWDVVLAPVSRMEARGLTAAMIDKGQPITLTGYARKDGSAEMRIERVKAGDKIVELR